MALPGADVLGDLCLRFILNVPSEELRSTERLLFQVEQAHWFYEDFVRDDQPHLRCGSREPGAGSRPPPPRPLRTRVRDTVFPVSLHPAAEPDRCSPHRDPRRPPPPSVRPKARESGHGVLTAAAARRSMKLREFAQVFFDGVPALQAFSGQVGEMMTTFNEYKLKVPVMGAILLDAELKHCLLVKGMKANASWGFPKGKRDKGEKDIDCAAREVLEETNFDASELLKEEWSIEVTTKKTQQRTKLYILPGVDKATPFEPRCRGEISEYAWFPVDDLPIGDNKVFTEDDGSRHNFFKVQPFTFALREWIKKRKKKGKKETGTPSRVGKKKGKGAEAAGGGGGGGGGGGRKTRPRPHKSRRRRRLSRCRRRLCCGRISG